MTDPEGRAPVLMVSAEGTLAIRIEGGLLAAAVEGRLTHDPLEIAKIAVAAAAVVQPELDALRKHTIRMAYLLGIYVDPCACRLDADGCDEHKVAFQVGEQCPNQETTDVIAYWLPDSEPAVPAQYAHAVTDHNGAEPNAEVHPQ